MTRPNALVLAGYGLNCEEETAFALDRGGAAARIVHINDLIAGTARLADFQALVIPGGFSFGDDTGSGAAFANKLRNHLWEELRRFVERDTLTLGICNGFQILANLGLIAPPGRAYGERVIGLMPNRSARYTARWVDLEIVNQTSPFLRGLDRLSVPIAHGEGRLVLSEPDRASFAVNNQIAARYAEGDICAELGLPADPNGSTDAIAALLDHSGRVMGMMPPPERAIFALQLPHWPRQKTNNCSPRADGPGLRMFQNIAAYFA
jgi:phosphoribosylformylglycinamidine synthase